MKRFLRWVTSRHPRVHAGEGNMGRDGYIVATQSWEHCDLHASNAE